MNASKNASLPDTVRLALLAGLKPRGSAERRGQRRGGSEEGKGRDGRGGREKGGGPGHARPCGMPKAAYLLPGLNCRALRSRSRAPGAAGPGRSHVKPAGC